jgi:tetratricopeptide (TPR) repeat protein
MQGRLKEAVAPFERMLQLRPDFAEGHMQMGCLQRDLGQLDLAIGHLQRALQLSPVLLDAAVFLANIRIFRGEMEEALGLCNQVLAKVPGHPEALSSKALILEKQGHFDAAWECLAPVVAGNAVTPSVAIVYAKLAPKYDNANHAISLLNSVLSRASWAPSQRQEMYFALGELNDKAGNHDSAFACYRSANELYSHQFDLGAMRNKAEKIIEIFSGDNIPAARHPSAELPTPIFIVGMPRSGTSLVEQILASHPDVAAAGELEVLSEVERRATGITGNHGSYPECLRSVSPSEMTTLAGHYLGAIANIAKGARFVTDKLPVNYERLGLIEKLFPNARIIHTSRHPLDTCLSCYFQNFGNTHTYSSDLRALGEVYRIYERLMRHWREKLSIRIHDLSYEALVSEPERTVRRLLEFCGLPWEPRCLEFHKSGRYVNTASYNQVRQPIYQRSVGRWKNYEAHLGELMAILSQEASVSS